MQRLHALIYGTLILLAANGCATADASAPKAEHRQVKVYINKEDKSPANVDLTVDGATHQFELLELKEGESRTVTTKAGKDIQLHRRGDKIVVDIDGKEVQLPRSHGPMSARFAPHVAHGDSESIIITGKKLTPEQEQKIEQAIKAAGIEAPVNFIHGEHRVLRMHRGEAPEGAHVEKIITIDGDFDGKIEIEEEFTEPGEKKEVKIIKKKVEK